MPDADPADFCPAPTDAAIDGGVVSPALRTGARVDRDDNAPGERLIERAVGDDGRRFEAAGGAGVEGPRDAEIRDIAVVDLVERREARFSSSRTVAFGFAT